MLQIVKQENKSPKYIEKIKSLGMEPNDVSVSESIDSGVVTGYALYSILGDCVKIYYIEAKSKTGENDLLLFDGIARSVLFLAVLKGVEKAEFSSCIAADAKMLGLSDENGTLKPISAVFNKCKGCAHADNSEG